MTLSAGEPSCSKEEDTGNERESFKGEDISYLAVLRGIQTPSLEAWILRSGVVPEIFLITPNSGSKFRPG